MNEFKREDRYLVIKRSDMCKYLDPKEQYNLLKIADKVSLHREISGKDRLECVVIEHDWQEYEPVWKMLEARVTSNNAIKAGRQLGKSEMTKNLVEAVSQLCYYCNRPRHVHLGDAQWCPGAHKSTWSPNE